MGDYKLLACRLKYGKKILPGCKICLPGNKIYFDIPEDDVANQFVLLEGCEFEWIDKPILLHEVGDHLECDAKTESTSIYCDRNIVSGCLSRFLWLMRQGKVRVSSTGAENKENLVGVTLEKQKSVILAIIMYLTDPAMGRHYYFEDITFSTCAENIFGDKVYSFQLRTSDNSPESGQLHRDLGNPDFYMSTDAVFYSHITRNSKDGYLVSEYKFTID